MTSTLEQLRSTNLLTCLKKLIDSHAPNAAKKELDRHRTELTRNEFLEDPSESSEDDEEGGEELDKTIEEQLTAYVGEHSIIED